ARVDLIRTIDEMPETKAARGAELRAARDRAFVAWRVFDPPGRDGDVLLLPAPDTRAAIGPVEATPPGPRRHSRRDAGPRRVGRARPSSRRRWRRTTPGEPTRSYSAVSAPRMKPRSRARASCGGGSTSRLAGRSIAPDTWPAARSIWRPPTET